MKTLKDIVTEKLVLNKSNAKQEYHYHPKDKDELKSLLKQLLKERGNDANLNDIDISQITDMSWLFAGSDPGNIDISGWDVSNVTDMNGMFYDCKNFNCDLSQWDVRNVKDIQNMFFNCYSLEKTPKWYEE